MRIVKYGIELLSLFAKDIELVRKWRNSKHVRQNMQYTKSIKPAEQQNWFNALDKATNLYFIIVSEGKKIGLINLKEINCKLKTAEAGIFIGDTSYLNSTVPVVATLTIMDFSFYVLGLKTLRAKMNSKNEKIISFNKALGYQKEPKQRNENFHYYQTNKKSYRAATKNISEFLNKVSPAVAELYINKNELDTLFKKRLNFRLKDFKVILSE